MNANLMMKMTAKRVAVASGLLAMAVLAATSYGQVREIVGGHVLDANPQVGSGGSNQPIPGYVPINGNAIITGNVTGLARFHGTVGSSSPYVFQGNLPTSSLEGFARQSAGGIPSGPAGSSPAPYYLPSTLTSGASGGLYPQQVGSGFESKIIPGSVSPTSAAYTSNPMVGTPYTPYTPMTRVVSPEETQAAAGNLITNSLFIQQQAAQDVRPGLPKPAEAKGTQTLNPQDPKQQDESNDGEPQTDMGTGRSKQVGSRTDTRVRGQNDVTNATGRETGPTQGGSRPQDLGSQARVSETYRTLLSDLQKARADAEKARLANGGETPASGTPSIDVGVPRGTAPSRTAAAEAARIRAERGIAGTSLLNVPTETLRAGQQVKPLDTLANVPSGGKMTSFDTQLKNAEAMLKNGKYMDALDAYQQALVLQPENSLAMIGRAHAELASGMYSSAAFDLKSVFTRKPEMVGVRYALNDFIPSKRIETLLTDLLALTQQERTSNMASFLYVYLAYNTGHPSELKQEIDRWEIRPNHDEWQAVAAKAWGK